VRPPSLSAHARVDGRWASAPIEPYGAATAPRNVWARIRQKPAILAEFVSKLLKSSGYTVVASRFGNDADAASFHCDTGVPTRNWTVTDFDAAQTNIAAIVKEFGPIDILINDAGITSDGTPHKMTTAPWRPQQCAPRSETFSFSLIGRLRRLFQIKCS